MPKQADFEAGQCYFVTKNTAKRKPIFEIKATVTLLLNDLAFYRKKFDYKIYAWVIMPDHYHLIIELNSQKYALFAERQLSQSRKYAKDPQRYYLSHVLEHVHSHSALVINQYLETENEPVWQHGFHVRPILDDRGLTAAVNYIHENPVKAELSSNAQQYAWSSYHALYNGDNTLFVLDQIDF